MLGRVSEELPRAGDGGEAAALVVAVLGVSARWSFAGISMGLGRLKLGSEERVLVSGPTDAPFLLIVDEEAAEERRCGEGDDFAAE